MEDSLTPIGMLERVVRVAERTLGPDHPATESRRQRLLRALAESGRTPGPTGTALPPHRRHDA